MRTSCLKPLRCGVMLVGMVGLAHFGPGCFMDSECSVNDDCGNGEVCADGECHYIGGTGTGSPSCADTSGDCSSTSCCDSSDVCVNFTAMGYTHCAARCYGDSDCASSCCRELQSGDYVCHSSSHPNCGGSGTCADTSEDCSNTTCCDSNDICVDFTAMGYTHCAARCSTDSGCASNCCRPLQSGDLVCHSSSHPNCS